MASAFQFGFGNPEAYSDWAGYAGLDRKTGMFGEQPPTVSAVKPPETMDELFQQKVVAPTQAKFTQAGEKVSNAYDQFSQGNIAKGIGAVSTEQKGWNLHGLLGD